jgi:hypothetical protein
VEDYDAIVSANKGLLDEMMATDLADLRSWRTTLLESIAR